MPRLIWKSMLRVAPRTSEASGECEGQADHAVRRQHVLAGCIGAGIAVIDRDRRTPQGLGHGAQLFPGIDREPLAADGVLAALRRLQGDRVVERAGKLAADHQVVGHHAIDDQAAGEPPTRFSLSTPSAWRTASRSAMASAVV
ncbi:hypothetical protein G6F59_015706 [Rhizopus arrhizus]|nr:hypothetical protein G6F59_015706 [Rhizopus arrhizus]